MVCICWIAERHYTKKQNKGVSSHFIQAPKGFYRVTLNLEARVIGCKIQMINLTGQSIDRLLDPHKLDLIQTTLIRMVRCFHFNVRIDNLNCDHDSLSLYCSVHRTTGKKTRRRRVWTKESTIKCRHNVLLRILNCKCFMFKW